MKFVGKFFETNLFPEEWKNRILVIKRIDFVGTISPVAMKKKTPGSEEREERGGNGGR